MTLPTNGLTAEVFRQAMPPYQLSADLLTDMFTAIAPPPRDATMAWRQTRATRLVHEVSGRMPADAPQARIAAEIVIYKEAAVDAVKRSGTPGMTVEQVCRLRRTAAVLTISTAALERTLVRQQQKPVPFFGTVLADGIDVAELAAGWGGRASPGDDGEDLGADLGVGVGVPVNQRVPAAETAPRSSALGQAQGTGAPLGQDAQWQALVGQGLPAITEDPAEAMEPGLAMTEDSDPDDGAEAPGHDGGLTDAPVPLAMAMAMAGSAPGPSVRWQAPGSATRGQDLGSNALGRDQSAMTSGREPASATEPVTERDGPPHAAQDGDATCGVVTRLDQGAGWTLDVVRRRVVGEGVAGEGGAGEGGAGNVAAGNLAGGTTAIATAADRLA
jgi:hypothetical protein